jgi:peptidoglycan hydrolase-like protein with peptidoglycan-binding domain
LWVKYGKNFSSFVSALQEVSNLDNGKLLSEINDIMKSHGFDLQAIVNQGLGVPDFTNIKTIQNALNELGFVVPVSGYLDATTFVAVKKFQVAAGFLNEDVDGIPGPQTVGELAKQVAQRIG